MWKESRADEHCLLTLYSACWHSPCPPNTLTWSKVMDTSWTWMQDTEAQCILRWPVLILLSRVAGGCIVIEQISNWLWMCSHGHKCPGWGFPFPSSGVNGTAIPQWDGKAKKWKGTQPVKGCPGALCSSYLVEYPMEAWDADWVLLLEAVSVNKSPFTSCFVSSCVTSVPLQVWNMHWNYNCSSWLL